MGVVEGEVPSWERGEVKRRDGLERRETSRRWAPKGVTRAHEALCVRRIRGGIGKEKGKSGQCEIFHFYTE